MIRIACPFVVVFLLCSALSGGQGFPAEREVWSLEENYWKYVQANDLEHYRTLWDDNFLGWPWTSPEPARKAQITNWITAHTSKGETLKSYNLERLVVQVTDNLATAAYRIRMTWVDKSGAEQPGSLRIIHTLHRNAGGSWQIISGMSAPTNAESH